MSEHSGWAHKCAGDDGETHVRGPRSHSLRGYRRGRARSSVATAIRRATRGSLRSRTTCCCRRDCPHGFHPQSKQSIRWCCGGCPWEGTTGARASRKPRRGRSRLSVGSDRRTLETASSKSDLPVSRARPMLSRVDAQPQALYQTGPSSVLMSSNRILERSPRAL